MNRRYSFPIIAVFLALIFAPCANAAMPGSVPTWVTNFRAVFLAETYIAALGVSDSSSGAKAEATADLARYFKTSVSADSNAIDIQSQVEMLAVEYTEPYHFKKEKKWYCAAFIERDKAWEQCKPAVESAKSGFYAMKNSADSESDPLTKSRLYAKAQKSGDNFLQKLEMARLVNPTKESAYSADRKAVSQMPALVASEREKCSVCLDIAGDFGNIMAACVSKALANGGFKIAKTKKEAAYIATALVQDNAIGSDPISITPSVDLKVLGKNGKTALAVQAAAPSKTVSYTLDNARKKAYPLLAQETEQAILNKLEEK